MADGDRERPGCGLSQAAAEVELGLRGQRGLLLARDKSLSKKLLAYHRIGVPEFEVFRIGRRITVMRDGRRVTTAPIDRVSVPELVRLMAGGSELAELEFELAAIKAEIAAPPG